jgi:hypothetical protein
MLVLAFHFKDKNTIFTKIIFFLKIETNTSEMKKKWFFILKNRSFYPKKQINYDKITFYTFNCLWKFHSWIPQLSSLNAPISWSSDLVIT